VEYHANGGGGGSWHTNRRTPGQLSFEGSPRSRRHQVAAAPPVIYCQVGVSHIYVTESQPPVIFVPTQVSHICSGGGDFRKLQLMNY